MTTGLGTRDALKNNALSSGQLQRLAIKQSGWCI